MPELTAIHFGLLALMLIIGAVVGWMMRADRCVKEKIAVSASWQDQMESQQSEHNRLAEQNKSLMEQIGQYQTSQKDYSNRARELSDSLKEVRGKLDVSVAQREKLQVKLSDGQSAAVKEKDDKIFHLSRELTSWQNRVPPLVDRFRERDAEAKALEDELNKARFRLRDLEEIVKSDHTRIEPLDADSLPDGGNASNESIAMTGLSDASDLQDQIDGESSLHEIFQKDSAASADESVSLDDDSFAAVFDEDSITADTNAENDAAAEADSLAADNNDDLQMIKGIGPSIEKTLHRLGIIRFHQIAEMSEYDIDQVAQQLRGFRSRIYREDWIGQARDLQYRKNNGKH